VICCADEPFAVSLLLLRPSRSLPGCFPLRRALPPKRYRDGCLVRINLATGEPYTRIDSLYRVTPAPILELLAQDRFGRCRRRVMQFHALTFALSRLLLPGLFPLKYSSLCVKRLLLFRLNLRTGVKRDKSSWSALPACSFLNGQLFVVEQAAYVPTCQAFQGTEI
jgi:hypothetical protein